MTTLLEEIIAIMLETTSTKKNKVSKKTAKSVYRRDYLRTRNKPYRKYDPEEYERKHTNQQ